MGTLDAACSTTTPLLLTLLGLCTNVFFFLPKIKSVFFRTLRKPQVYHPGNCLFLKFKVNTEEKKNISRHQHDTKTMASDTKTWTEDFSQCGPKRCKYKSLCRTCKSKSRRNLNGVKLCTTYKCTFKILELSVLTLKWVTNSKYKEKNSANTPDVLSCTHISTSAFFQEGR